MTKDNKFNRKQSHSLWNATKDGKGNVMVHRTQAEREDLEDFEFLEAKVANSLGLWGASLTDINDFQNLPQTIRNRFSIVAKEMQQEGEVPPKVMSWGELNSAFEGEKVASVKNKIVYGMKTRQASKVLDVPFIMAADLLEDYEKIGKTAMKDIVDTYKKDAGFIQNIKDTLGIGSPEFSSDEFSQEELIASEEAANNLEMAIINDQQIIDVVQSYWNQSNGDINTFIEFLKNDSTLQSYDSDQILEVSWNNVVHNLLDPYNEIIASKNAGFIQNIKDTLGIGSPEFSSDEFSQEELIASEEAANNLEMAIINDQQIIDVVQSYWNQSNGDINTFIEFLKNDSTLQSYDSDQILEVSWNNVVHNLLDPYNEIIASKNAGFGNMVDYGVNKVKDWGNRQVDNLTNTVNEFAEDVQNVPGEIVDNLVPQWLRDAWNYGEDDESVTASKKAKWVSDKITDQQRDDFEKFYNDYFRGQKGLGTKIRNYSPEEFEDLVISFYSEQDDAFDDSRPDWKNLRFLMDYEGDEEYEEEESVTASKKSADYRKKAQENSDIDVEAIKKEIESYSSPRYWEDVELDLASALDYIKNDGVFDNDDFGMDQLEQADSLLSQVLKEFDVDESLLMEENPDVYEDLSFAAQDAIGFNFKFPTMLFLDSEEIEMPDMYSEDDEAVAELTKKAERFGFNRKDVEECVSNATYGGMGGVGVIVNDFSFENVNTKSVTGDTLLYIRDSFNGSGHIIFGSTTGTIQYSSLEEMSNSVDSGSYSIGDVFGVNEWDWRITKKRKAVKKSADSDDDLKMAVMNELKSLPPVSDRKLLSIFIARGWDREEVKNALPYVISELEGEGVLTRDDNENLVLVDGKEAAVRQYGKVAKKVFNIMATQCPKVAVDAKAEDYWKAYYGPYGEQLVKEVKKRIKADLAKIWLMKQGVDEAAAKYWQNYFTDENYGEELTKDIPKRLSPKAKRVKKDQEIDYVKEK
jgi:hypothetical protein